MGYAEVIRPGFKFWLGLLFTAMGVMLVLAAVCTAVASSTSHHDFSFHFVVTVLVFSAVVGVLVLTFLVLKRRETPLQQVQYVQYNNANMVPVGVVPAPAVAPAAM
eukprot:Phypoly_transcript_23981.p1 GENE.Phypoly_transcript_23981~~Phypoly_transcript_23981.p1  ORF type:complete len:106 (-),score=14.75 Phypoly_transcript_23981:101-418(-)